MGNEDVYRAAIKLARKYARAGVEGKIHGHILVLGDASKLKELGKLNKYDPFSRGNGTIMDDNDAEEVRRCMDADGISIIDGQTGAPCANKFFSHGTSSSSNASGGA